MAWKVVRALVVVAVAVVVMAAPARPQGVFGPIERNFSIAGDWMYDISEDWYHRGAGAELGDYTGLPINASVRQKAEGWDASILSLPEHMARPHPAEYFMRGPGVALRITKVVDPQTQKLIAFTIEGTYGRHDRIIWMDGRPHPSENMEHTWSGFSTGEFVGNQLVVTTTHIKYGFIQRNGVAASDKAKVIDVFVRHGNYLTDIVWVDDPLYLEEPFVRTSHWTLSQQQIPNLIVNLEVVDEIAGRPRGYVPHYPLATKHDEFANLHGIPFEATQGGRETIYPEYELKLRKMIAERPAAKASTQPAGQ